MTSRTARRNRGTSIRKSDVTTPPAELIAPPTPGPNSGDLLLSPTTYRWAPMWVRVAFEMDKKDEKILADPLMQERLDRPANLPGPTLEELVTEARELVAHKKIKGEAKKGEVLVLKLTPTLFDKLEQSWLTRPISQKEACAELDKTHELLADMEAYEESEDIQPRTKLGPARALLADARSILELNSNRRQHGNLDWRAIKDTAKNAQTAAHQAKEDRVLVTIRRRAAVGGPDVMAHAEQTINWIRGFTNGGLRGQKLRDYNRALKAQGFRLPGDEMNKGR